MKNRQRQNQWTTAAQHLLARFKADLRNHQILGDPWLRAASCMLNAWRIRLSQSRRPKLNKPTSIATTWFEAARRMKASLHTRARDQRLKGTWEYWARHRPPIWNRYLKKASQDLTFNDSGQVNSADS
jgi:hypothetical protein